MRPVTWRSYAVVAVLLAAYAVLGLWLSGDGEAETWIYRVGLALAAVVPVVFVLIYTSYGVWGHKGKWWTNPFGAALVTAALSLVPIAGPLAWVFWFDNGMMTASWLAWLEVSGPCIAIAAWVRMCFLWLRIYRTLPPEPPMRPHLEDRDGQAD